MWNIQLQTAGLNEWLDAMEQKLTLAGDLLDVMETEAEQLKEVWESGAGEIWKREFQIHVGEVRLKIAEMKKVVLNIGEMGKMLADMESNMIMAAEKL